MRSKRSEFIERQRCMIRLMYWLTPARFAARQYQRRMIRSRTGSARMPQPSCIIMGLVALSASILFAVTVSARAREAEKLLVSNQA